MANSFYVILKTVGRLVLLIYFVGIFPLSADYFACRRAIDKMLPQLYDEEYKRMREFVQHFVAAQVRDMPPKQAKRILEIFEKGTHFLPDEDAYRSHYAAAVVSDVDPIDGLTTELVFYNKYLRHPFIGLSFVHEFAHLKDFVRGNPHVDAVRYLIEFNLRKGTVIRKEAIAAQAEYKYLKEFYTSKKLEEMKRALDNEKYFELRKKFLPLRRKLRADPFHLEKYSKEELEAYGQWVLMGLDRKLVRRLELAFSLNESDYVSRISQLFPYRIQNSTNDKLVAERRSAFITQATKLLGHSVAMTLAYSVFETDNDEEETDV